MKKASTILAVALLILGLSGCGGSSSTPTSPSSASALLLVSQTSVGLVGLSSSPDHLVRLEMPVSFSNGREVPCSLNYAQMQIYDAADVEVERASVTADDIIALAGTNRVVQGAPVQVTLIFNFNTLEIYRVALTVNATDDNGHDINRSLNSFEVELAPELQPVVDGA